MNILTRKVEIKIVEGDEKILDNWAYACRRMANIVLSKKYALEKVSEYISLTDEGSKLILDKIEKGGHLNTSNMNFMYKELSIQFKDIPSNIRAGLTRHINQTYQKKKSDIHKGLASLPTYRNNLPIPFNINPKAKDRFFEKSEKEFTFSPFGKEFKFKTRFGRDRSNNRAIVENIYEGNYRICDSAIKIDGNKIFLLLAFKSPKQGVSLDKDVVVSMNLGLNVPVYLACSNEQHKKIGNKDTMLHQRTAIQGAMRRIYKQSRFTKGGKGRKKKIQAIEQFKKKERNLVKTINHKISYDVIAFALKENAGTILIEDLKGIGERASKFVLRNWSYFELQNFITYKAAKWDIEVITVRPLYITQECNKCGFTSEENIDGENLVCKGCGHEIHRDYNAALNNLDNFVGKSVAKGL